MKKIFRKIWELALPYQDKRNDKGHAEITLNYATKLLESENGNKDVIIPAIILHDTGWSQLTREEKFIIYDHDTTREEKISVKYKHQDESVKIGHKILNEVDYPSKLTDEILEIVSQHDTREGFISKNEGLVRDADKLWRFSKTGFDVNLIENKFSFRQFYDKLINNIELLNFFYSDRAKQIAYEELETRKEEYSNTEK